MMVVANLQCIYPHASAYAVFGLMSDTGGHMSRAEEPMTCIIYYYKNHNI